MFLQKLQRFLYGRYGTDKFSLFLLILGLVLTLIGGLFFRPLVLVADLFYLYAIFRSFSRNISARQKEYRWFLKWYGPVESAFRLQKQKFAQRKTYKYFKCPACRQQLRAPRGRGKIEVTCQNCRSVFQTKT